MLTDACYETFGCFLFSQSYFTLTQSLTNKQSVPDIARRWGAWTQFTGPSLMHRLLAKIPNHAESIPLWRMRYASKPWMRFPVGPG
jgi:hypothetical protein